MSENSIQLVSLLNENLLEIGDLKNIIDYSYTSSDKLKYNFNTDEGGKVDVRFTLLTPLEILRVNTPPIIDRSKIEQYFNLGYSIGGISTQARKSNIGEILKIIKTITKIIEEFRVYFPNSAIMIFEENKNQELGIFSGQKSLLYKATISYNIPSDLISRPIKYGEIEGTIISPK